jgi:hypothetical protein
MSCFAGCCSLKLSKQSQSLGTGCLAGRARDDAPGRRGHWHASLPKARSGQLSLESLQAQFQEVVVLGPLAGDVSSLVVRIHDK